MWFRRAAEQNYPAAQRNYGRCYEEGNGVYKNIEEAFKWYLLAAAQGDATAETDVLRFDSLLSRSQIVKIKEEVQILINNPANLQMKLQVEKIAQAKAEAQAKADAQAKIDAQTKAEAQAKADAQAKIDAQAKADARDKEAKAKVVTQEKEKARAELINSVKIRGGFLLVIGLLWASFRKVQRTKTDLKKGVIGWIDGVGIVLTMISLAFGPMIIVLSKDVLGNLTGGGSGSSVRSSSSFSGSHKSARQLIRDRAESLYGRRVDVTIDSGFYGGAYQVTVSDNEHFHNYTIVAEVDEKNQKITSWETRKID